jgi:hypothetical protein
MFKIVTTLHSHVQLYSEYTVKALQLTKSLNKNYPRFYDSIYAPGHHYMIEGLHTDSIDVGFNGLGNTVQSSNHVLRTRLAWVNNYDGYSESRLNADSPGVSAGTTESIPRPRDQP